MYIQITTKCNMFCDHCGFSCGPRGIDMNRETFIAACKLAYNHGSYIDLGGGEPTCHDLLFDYIGIALKYSADSEISPFITINGKKTEEALQLAGMAKKGIISVRLSQDYYHESIDPKVVKAFTVDPSKTYGYRQHDNDMRSIRQWGSQIIYAGRGKKIIGAVNQCICPEIFVTPKGDIYPCGCKTKKIGTVFTGIDSSYDLSEHDGCQGIELKESKNKPPASVEV